MHGTNQLPAPAARRPLDQVLRAIVVDALRVGVGETLPTNSHYLRTVGASAGTVQRAIKTLADQEALVTASHGHQGRTVGSLHVGAAWHIAGLSPLRLLFPPSGPAEIDALTEALAGELTELGVPHTIRHQRGGTRRLAALHAGAYDLAVVSSGAFRGATQASDAAPSLTLAPGTYYAPHRLVAVTRTGDDPPGPGARVAIDDDSPDHVLLTQSAFPPDRGYTYVNCRFPEVPTAVLRRQVDVGIWHLSHTVIPLDLAGLSCADMERLDTVTDWREVSAAVLVGGTQRGELRSVLASIRLPNLFSAQQQWLRDESS
ncbi:hypothetical protein OG896_37170 [Streptomyces sp. NBC_00669]|uniref:YhfZ family protein n=1 Tax=unclassified Streptomyces TaxID=2593676 RepID=UPI002E352F9E|nr:YhfZ family protein [Streptomyces sp. NBC_00669]